MDMFGIGNGVLSCVQAFFSISRRTGRTTQLVENVKQGDRVVFLTDREAGRVHRLILARGINVECIVVGAEDPERLLERGNSTGRTIFDHSWVEQYYVNCVESARKRIDYLERETSGCGATRRETKAFFDMKERGIE